MEDNFHNRDFRILYKEQSNLLAALYKTLNEINALIKDSTLLQKDVLTVEEASKLTGLSSSDLYKKTSQNVIPHYKPGGKKVYFRWTDLEAWLTQNRSASMQEVQEKAALLQIRSNN